MQCRCDRGYSGSDCSRRTCAHGDDVLTTCQELGTSDVQYVHLEGGGNPEAFVLQFSDHFGGEYVTQAIPNLGSATAGAIQDALESLPNFAIPSVQVSSHPDPAKGSMTWEITFSDPATPGMQKLIQCEALAQSCAAGAQPKYAPTVGPCETGRIHQREYTENVACGNRGLCDGQSGSCECFDGHTGEACEVQSTFV